MKTFSILPLGKINLETGKSKYFNVYETWEEDTTYEIYEVSENNFKIVATSGKEPLNKLGEFRDFKHDQNFRYLFSGKMIAFAVGSDLKKVASKYGKSIAGYTYK
jgi:hypothetical protein